jgi:hypothetical protein
MNPLPPSARKGAVAVLAVALLLCLGASARALSTLDDAKRAALLQEAMVLAARDVACITLFRLSNSWTTRKDLVYDARADEQTIAMAVSRAR